LNARAELAPPTKFFTLEDGEPVPQHALNRTRNVVSKPEVTPPAESSDADTRHWNVEHLLIEKSRVEQGEK